MGRIVFGSNIPSFYGLSKVHKAYVPLKPIVAAQGSVTYQLPVINLESSKWEVLP